MSPLSYSLFFFKRFGWFSLLRSNSVIGNLILVWSEILIPLRVYCITQFGYDSYLATGKTCDSMICDQWFDYKFLSNVSELIIFWKQVTVAYNNDPSPVKINLGVGAYRTEVIFVEISPLSIFMVSIDYCFAKLRFLLVCFFFSLVSQRKGSLSFLMWFVRQSNCSWMIREFERHC